MGTSNADAWKAVHSALQALLYERDPEGMGASVGAPLDEYGDVATRLIREMRHRHPGTTAAMSVSEVLPTAWPELVDEIVDLYSKYETP